MHHPIALKEGLGRGVADAIADGRRPSGMAADEELIYDFCTELLRNHSVSDATYARAVRASASRARSRWWASSGTTRSSRWC